MLNDDPVGSFSVAGGEGDPSGVWTPEIEPEGHDEWDKEDTLVVVVGPETVTVNGETVTSERY